METRAILQLYRNYFLYTRNCRDRSLKLYIRRRATEDFRRVAQLGEADARKEFDRLKEEAEVVRRQMGVRHMYTN